MLKNLKFFKIIVVIKGLSNIIYKYNAVQIIYSGLSKKKLAQLQLILPSSWHSSSNSARLYF